LFNPSGNPMPFRRATKKNGLTERGFDYKEGPKMRGQSTGFKTNPKSAGLGVRNFGTNKEVR